MSGVNVLWVAKYPPNAGRGLSHKHEFYQLTYPLSGRIIVNEEFYVNKGEAMLAPPERYHSFFSVKEDESRAVVFDCKFTVTDPELHSSLAAMDFKLTFSDFPRILRYTESIIEEANEKSLFYQQNIDSILTTLLVGTVRDSRKSIYNTKDVSNDPAAVLKAFDDNGNKADINMLREYIDGNAEKISCLEDLSAFMHINKTTLTEIFRRSFGTTPMKYVNHRRFLLARDMLLHTNMTVSEISEKTGFGSIHYFCKVFKDKAGISPMAYRERGEDAFIELPHSEDYDHRGKTVYI
ncbi:MAG: helix-turn-helix domain-containing protein [Ruminococcaceae bacterium]|nr:helix-turn-helix domain-containing protein [Oscillospiraceae bacterium]